MPVTSPSLPLWPRVTASSRPAPPQIVLERELASSLSCLLQLNPSPTEFLPSPFPLQEAEVSLIDNKECETFFHTSESIGQYNIIKDDMICAGDMKNGKSICLVSDHGANTAAELSHLSNPGQQATACVFSGSLSHVGGGTGARCSAVLVAIHIPKICGFPR